MDQKARRKKRKKQN
jgi:hypothetical protein